MASNKRNGTNSILFCFTSIIDTEFGAIQYFYKKYYQQKPYSDLFFMPIEPPALVTRRALRDRYYANPLSIYSSAYGGSDKDEVDKAWEMLMSDKNYGYVLNRSTIETVMWKMILTYLESGSIRITIYCKNKLEESYCNQMFEGKDINIISDLSDIEEYDAIFCKYIDDFVELFPKEKVAGKNIYIADFKLNNNKITGDIDIERIYNYLDTNIFQIYTYYNQGVIQHDGYYCTHKRCREVYVKACSVRNPELLKRRGKKF